MARSSRSGPNLPLAVLAAVLALWALFGGGGGCLPPRPPPPGPLCPTSSVTEIATGSSNIFLYDWPGKVVDARGADWVGQVRNAIELDGPSYGCFQGGGITGTWDMAATWQTLHTTAAISVRANGQPMRVMSIHARNYGDGVSIEPYVPCPNGSQAPWLTVRSSHLEDIRDDAIESDGLCSMEISDNLIERAFVAFAFRNRQSEPDRAGFNNIVTVDGNLVRLHAFANNYMGQPGHNGFWKWAHQGRGPAIRVRNNLFLAFDVPRPGSTLFPLVNRVNSCSNNELLFAGSEAEWQQALAGGCDNNNNDGLCDGQRMLALSYCYTVITKSDSETEADFLATHWDPHAAAWKAAHTADDE